MEITTADLGLSVAYTVGMTRPVGELAVAGQAFPFAVQGGQDLLRRGMQAWATHLRPAGSVDSGQRPLELGRRRGVGHGGGFSGGHRPVSQVQIRDPGQPRIPPGPQLLVGITGADEVPANMRPAPQRVNAVHPGQ